MNVELQYAPQDLLEKLEFNKIIELAQSYCAGELANQIIAQTPILTNRLAIEEKLLEVEQMAKTYQEGHHFPQGEYVDLSEEFHKLNIEGYTLSFESFQALQKQLMLAQATFHFFGGGKKRDIVALYPNLFAKISHIEFADILVVAINRIFNEEGQFKIDASPELQRLGRLRNSKQQELDKRFRAVAQHYMGKGQLADIVESFRNARRVLAVLAEYKRQVRGIMHDESATGRTVFIEPEEVIDINNELFNIEQEERREIYRILRELSAIFHPYAATLQLYQDIIVDFDVIQAKARLGYTYNGKKPLLQEQPCFKIERALHPLLYLKNQRTKQRTVAFDLEFRNDNRILVLSGPNAGGKSICMKAVGLLQLMVQAGFLIPVEEGSEMGVFKKFFGDIGDQQSLEDELSTYSSRLRNSKEMLENSDSETIVFIDEFGTGTDPKMGGAIAESILRKLNQKKVFGVITTHYSNLKHFANKNKGIVNGAMIFNKETLSPTYQMRIGKPGSSYAFEVAEKSQLPKDVIDYAKEQVGQETHELDSILIDVQQERLQLQEQQKELAEQQKRLDALIKNYEKAAGEVEFTRKNLQLQQKASELDEIKKAHRATVKELQKAVEELRKIENQKEAAATAKQLIQQTNQEKKQLTQSVENIKEEIHQTHEVKTLIKELSIGSHVRLRDGVTIGIIKELKKKDAVVEIDNFTVTLPIIQLQPIEAPKQEAHKLSHSVRQEMRKQADAFEPAIDIRGMLHDEAMEMVQEFMDKALLASSVYELRIIHGKGTGSLRRAVLAKLKSYPSIQSITHAPDNQGGDGVTLVSF